MNKHNTIGLHVRTSDDLIPYEDISASDPGSAEVNAENAIKSGWSRRGYPPVDLAAIPWRMTDASKRSWNFLIHCWDMLDSQLKAFQYVGDSKFLDVSVNAALSWAEFISTEDPKSNSMAWYDMAVGLRTYRLAFILDACSRDLNRYQGVLEPLHEMLKLHHLYLQDEANIVYHNNHGFYQVAGQIAMGRRFMHQDDAMKEAYQQGKIRLKKLLQSQFSIEGIHLEHSPDYHRMVYETFKALVQNGLVDDNQAELALKIETALAWFVLPDLHIANFGDSDYRLMKRKPNQASAKWLYDAMRYAVTSGELGVKPSSDWICFKDSGYFIVKSDYQLIDGINTQTGYLAQQAGFHSRTHKHADELSFIWSEGNQNILVDSGRYGYLGKTKQGSELWQDGFWYSDPNRVYVESTRAHNCLEFDAKNQPRKNRKAYGSAIKSAGKYDNDVYAVESEIRLHNSVRQQRVLIYRPGYWLVVFDWYKDNLNKEHSVKQWFQISPDLGLNLSDKGPELTKEGETLVSVANVGSQTTQISSYIGEKYPQMQGWFSPKEREIIPIHSLCFAHEKSTQGTFSTIFSLGKTMTIDQKLLRVAPSGQSMQLHWTDDTGSHTLTVERGPDSEMSVSYEHA